MVAGRDRPGEGSGLPTRAGSEGVLDGPAVQADRRRAGVEQLDEVVREARAGVAPAGVHLADDDARRRDGRGRRGKEKGSEDEGGEEAGPVDWRAPVRGR